MNIYSKTDTGIVRKINEDCYSNFEDERIKLYVVADGMGGHNAGEVASSLAVETFMENFKEQYKDSDNLEETLVEAIRIANQQVRENAQKDEAVRDMGTTLVCTLIEKNHMLVANVGDSRCYIQRDGILQQITKDHSLLNDLLEHGTITEEEAKDYIPRNVITRSLGMDETVDIDLFDLNLQQDDYIILCTDGLNAQIADETIEELLKEEIPLEEKVNSLIEIANESGGIDNITITLYQHRMVM